MQKKRRLQHWQAIGLILAAYDAIAVNAAYLFALLLRFDFIYSKIPIEYLSTWEKVVPLYTAACLLIFYVLRLYRSLWRFASYTELVRVIAASALTTLVQIVLTSFIQRMPISYFMAGAVMQFMLTLGIRFSYRFILLVRSGSRRGGAPGGTVNIMLIGAGNAGQMILRDFHRAKEIQEHVACVIDDNPNKWGRYIDGVPVVGGRDTIVEAVQKYNIKKIYMAIPSATAVQKRDILDICKDTGCELKQLPGMFQLATGEVTVSKMRNVSVDDLLGREPVRSDLSGVFESIRGKVVLVTGGGGSIGSELCRQIASHRPEQLIIFDIYENNAYDIQLELRARYPGLNLVVLIGSVRDSRKMDDLFDKYHPDIVYHAAAHKHVPLMEDSPCEAIKNNVIGTYKTAYAAMAHGCSRFVLISTDKAVNPTNIMGASKRICEMIIQTFDMRVKEERAEEIPRLFTHEMADGEEIPTSSLREARTQFCAVRFGNVLGSNGSVIPVFRKQIAEGGPVTVTSPDIIRYFMTIPEAVSLVLLAGTYAEGGDIFVLDMGSPIKIDTLARNLIKLSGYKPDVDIKIEYTGLRPGEKLYEEKLMAEEGLRKTENDLIFIGQPIPFDNDLFLEKLHKLMEASYQNEDGIRDYVMDIVSTYKPGGS